MLRSRDPRWRAGDLLAGSLLLPALLALAFFASCNNPQAPPSGSTLPGFRGQYDHAGQVLEFRLETPTGGVSALRLVASNLVFDAATQDLHAQVAIRNAGSETLPGPSGVAIGSFDPATVVPVNAKPLPCPLCMNCPCPFPFLFEYAGAYGGDEALAPGETSTPVEWIFHDPGAESFSFRAALQPREAALSGTISGSVFEDTNGDGHRQEAERGIAGVKVMMLHGDSTSVAITGARGRFEFRVSEEGLYEVLREPAADCDPTTPGRRQVFIVRRPDGSLSGYAGADFGCRAAGPVEVQVTGMVYEDLNRDGQHQKGEPGLANVLIDGATPNCPTLVPIQVRTDEHGLYKLQLPACEPPYVITRQPLRGYVDTTPNPVILPGGIRGDSTIVPGSPADSMPPMPPLPVFVANFGVARVDSTQESSVEGVVFEDTNRNGSRENGEPGIPGVGVSASGLECMTPVLGVTRTDALGHYLLRQSDVHCPLPWSVRQEPIAGMCNTSQNPVVVGLDLGPDPRHYKVDFGVAPCDSLPVHRLAIDGVVFVDLNRDGHRDPGEPGVPLIEVQLMSKCDVWRAVRTDLRGHYRFEPDMVAMCPVDAVWLSVPQFAAHTTPNPAPLPPLMPGQDLVSIDFGVVLRMPR